MDRDRTAICQIIGGMLDNPDEHGIFSTSTCFTKLEHYIETVRAEALGFAHGYACSILDEGKDPRTIQVPELLEKAREILA